MFSVGLELIVMLIVILVAAEIFTNALEHLGAKLKISEGVTGSIFAAVGTALPETMVPLLAIFAGTSNANINAEIGVGAILGSPLMLSTLTTCLMALAILPKRGITGHIKPEQTGFIRDINFFIFAFALAAAAMYLPETASYLRVVISFMLVFTYFVYLLLTIRASNKLVARGHVTAVASTMFFARFGIANNLIIIILQLSLGLGLLVFGAEGFITCIADVSDVLHISTLLLSLLIIPIATELPEKINSILWIRRGKDTLAFGNITGAMVFHGTCLTAIGITLTPWQPQLEVLTGVVITLVAAISLRVSIKSGRVPVWALLFNGLLYLSYLIITFCQ